MLDLKSWASGSILTGGNILLLDFLFSRSKDFEVNNGIIAILVHFEKTLMHTLNNWTSLICKHFIFIC